ncbi:MAG: phosphoglycerate mutase family protein [Ligilactobacillus agilis]|uniref:histidine phosphatase family protein n=1 Tax=Ligilactobacillus agilis TaxID=1601 RepID=UPI00242BBE2E|nr:histidine phosphatase family protein [Ligilactobacillus agilis]MCI5762090.1 phosphoglycerate mutase family protein [Ligilactobacillus agilis]MDY4064681.1 histidine phosphatase family protein [Ligilactobacillus agilis]
MTKTLYLMRHGQTLFNQMHKIQGVCDSPLTDLGINQAQLARTYFDTRKIQLTAAFCSTSERASDTLKIVTNNSLPYTRLKGLKEWNFGRFEGQDEALNPPLPYEDFFKTFGGEGQSEVGSRMEATILDLMKTAPSENVLAVSHGAACACFYRQVTGQSQLPVRGIKNCSIFKYEYKNGKLTYQDLWQPDFSQLNQ